MVQRVRNWIALGIDVRIFTARVSGYGDSKAELTELGEVIQAIMSWCEQFLGETLPITCIKDMHTVEIWDDRAVAVEFNTGRILGRNE